MSVLTQKNGRTMLEDTAYSVLKKVVQVVLPAAATLYFALASIWHLPDATQVIGSIAAVTTFLGVSLHISSTQFDVSGAAYDGTVHVTQSDTGSNVNFNVAPTDLVTKDAVTFKVVKPSDSVLPSPPADGGPPTPVTPTATNITPLPPTTPPVSS